jgi:hypothetical protein
MADMKVWTEVAAELQFPVKENPVGMGDPVMKPAGSLKPC